MADKEKPKPLRWRGDAKDEFAAFPPAVQRELGFALFLAQMGERHRTMAKTLRGFGGGSVIELRENDDGDTYRAIYTVHYADAVYVLHAFQKKSKSGSKTALPDIDLIERRLKALKAERERQ